MAPNVGQNQPGLLDWFKFAFLAVQLLGTFLAFLRERKLLDAGAAQAIAKVLRAQADDLHKMQDTMAAAGARFDAAGRMPDDGKFRD